ncbi:MAG TPA: 3',5'-nucleoside bisphosphate phosphatase [Zoogloea sp.]|jgi:predicted metal-dependent phosphoesterase TrpH|uniref:3',5'-nucleoside bisphosphate phosphatase n=1 Tax=Zoogloea sp. TaxID=49181 RepID=UPI001B74073D|nr:3',5'-nucleoside bisphosphate phosphatase [Zoogloea sp.]MBP8265793.1 PHP domain-containing protein [Zoogloea sp.]HOB47071.1 3',5'-nucleoside bisphosphate phosphatase [Zoogloea sp.]HQA11172.1 3',5'-nucleoside bisphosphate phosphatase [Zoogloea sp.]HQE38608.1 3',5'-nucleoside bisphosphate phosphatase [Zoogloea sp.]
MNALNADLHCHSTASDGTLPPAEVVRRAHANGVDLLALTDHDELLGLPEASATAADLGLRFVPGVEVSVSWLDQTLHIVGLGIDPANPALIEGLAKVRGGRDGRSVRIAAELDRIGIHGALEGALRYVGNPALVSRAHFARYLVEIGVSKNVHDVFLHYLARGKPGYVEHIWATLEDALGWIKGAGGLAVVAHPGRYRLSHAEMDILFDKFCDLGGDAVEVSCGAHDGGQVLAFARVARKFGLMASRASDFHGPEDSPIDLGKAPPLPPDLIPVWSRLI